MSEPNSETVRAVVVDPEAPTHLGFGERPLRSPSAQDVVVEVACFSLNRGELRFAAGKPKGAPIGWDVAGVVERGGGLPAGTRVVGFVRAQDGWAEKVVLPASDVAPLPDGVDFPTAAALPVAGGTALAVVDAAGPGLLGARALVTGVTGGVGGLAVQLARAAGATVVAQVRRPEQVAVAEALGADEVVVTEDGAALADQAPFRLVADAVGGALLQNAIERLAPDGIAVSYGVTGAADVSLPLRALFGKGRASLRGLNLYAVSEVSPPRQWLTRLLELCERGRLRPDVVDRGDWSAVAQVADDLLARRFMGKAVLHVA